MTGQRDLVVFVLPLERLEFCGANQVVIWTLIALAYAGLTASISIGGLILPWLRPGLGFEEPLDFLTLLILGADTVSVEHRLAPANGRGDQRVS